MSLSPADVIRARYGHLPFAPPAALPEGMMTLLGRRVTRRYRPEAVPESLLALVLAAAQSAPSKSDLQQYSIIVTRDAAKIAAIAAWIGTMPWIAEAPLFLLFCGDMRRGQLICEGYGRQHANNTLDGLLNAATDAALALAFAVMAAEMMGLGSCPISYVRNHLERIAPLFGLPDGVFPFAGLTLGWPAEERAVSPRLPPAVVVHDERYDAAGLAAAIAAYDALRPRQKPRYPEVHGPAPAGCSWSENAARQLAVPERLGLRAWLRQRGFALD